MLLKLEIPGQEVDGEFLEGRTIIAPIEYYQSMKNRTEYFFAMPYVPLDSGCHDDDTTVTASFNPGNRRVMIHWIERGASYNANLEDVHGCIVESFPPITWDVSP